MIGISAAASLDQLRLDRWLLTAAKEGQLTFLQLLSKQFPKKPSPEDRYEQEPPRRSFPSDLLLNHLSINRFLLKCW
jgi:hypothetical protein